MLERTPASFRRDRGPAECEAQLGSSEGKHNGLVRAAGELRPNADRRQDEPWAGNAFVKHQGSRSPRWREQSPLSRPAARCAVPRSGKPDRLANTMTLPSRYLFRRVQ